MGKTFFDQYSLLHFATGVVAYFLGLSWQYWLIIHVIFELIENTQQGINFINNHLLWFWPGGKDYADYAINSLGDNVFAMLGWFVAYKIDTLFKNNNII